MFSKVRCVCNHSIESYLATNPCCYTDKASSTNIIAQLFSKSWIRGHVTVINPRDAKFQQQKCTGWGLLESESQSEWVLFAMKVCTGKELTVAGRCNHEPSRCPRGLYRQLMSSRWLLFCPPVLWLQQTPPQFTQLLFSDLKVDWGQKGKTQNSSLPLQPLLLLFSADLQAI